MDQQSSYQFILSILLAAIQSCEDEPLEPNGAIAALLRMALEVYREAGWPEEEAINYMYEVTRGVADK